jgi:hypothetical protein
LWFDPTSIDLVHALSDDIAQAPILILSTARPEFRQPWGAQAHHTVISLGPLGEAQVQRMIAELLSQRTLSAEVMRRVSERAGGVPLFVEVVTRLMSNGAQTDPRIGAQKGPLFGDKCRRQRSPRRSWSGLRSRGERGLASSRLLEGQARFLKRQLSLPVSTMSQ